MSRTKKTIAVLPGDGIGPEVTQAAVLVLRDCGAEYGHTFEFVDCPVGGAAIDAAGDPLPPATLDACRRADAVLLGAVGGPRWDALPIGRRPESGLLALRKGLDLYVNVRPIRLREALRGISPVRRADRIDLEIVRELAGGIYFGAHRVEPENGCQRATDVETYTTAEIERVASFAFGRAAARRRRLASVDKANVLASSVLWRGTVNRLAESHPSVQIEHLYVDNAAMQLVLAPGQFDVILTTNMFGDILSDCAAALVGSIGLVPSMSCGSGPPLFEPTHGSAPALAGKDCACPLGAIFSATLMLRRWGLSVEAGWIESAVDEVLESSYRTPDIAEKSSTVVSCSNLVERIRAEMRASVEQPESYGWGV